MSRRTRIVIIILGIVGILGGLVALVLPRPTPQQPAAQVSSKLFDTSIKEAIADSITTAEQPVTADDLIIIKRKDSDGWIFLTIIHKKESPQSEVYVMTYVVKVEGETVRLMAFSGDSFSKESFQEEVDDRVIEEANNL